LRGQPQRWTPLTHDTRKVLSEYNEDLIFLRGNLIQIEYQNYSEVAILTNQFVHSVNPSWINYRFSVQLQL